MKYIHQRSLHCSKFITEGKYIKVAKSIFSDTSLGLLSSDIICLNKIFIFVFFHKFQEYAVEQMLSWNIIIKWRHSEKIQKSFYYTINLFVNCVFILKEDHNGVRWIIIVLKLEHNDNFFKLMFMPEAYSGIFYLSMRVWEMQSVYSIQNSLFQRKLQLQLFSFPLNNHIFSWMFKKS